jgi:hypothetical protein
MKKILLIPIIFLTLTFPACVDLDLNPLSEGSSSNWYSTQQEIEMSVNDFYRTDFFPIDDMLWGDDVTARNYYLSSTEWNDDGRARNSGQPLAKLLQRHCTGPASD